MRNLFFLIVLGLVVYKWNSIKKLRHSLYYAEAVHFVRKAWAKIDGVIEHNKESRPAAVGSLTRRDNTADSTPPCSLSALNSEYAKFLDARRHKASPDAPDVHYDPVLFEGCRAFNKVLERKNKLYHAGTRTGGELCGYSSVPLPQDPKELAEYIYIHFRDSPRHNRIQSKPELAWVSVSVTQHYYVVRLSRREVEGL